jgi:hypothetical protein
MDCGQDLEKTRSTKSTTGILINIAISNQFIFDASWHDCIHAQALRMQACDPFIQDMDILIQQLLQRLMELMSAIGIRNFDGIIANFPARLLRRFLNTALQFLNLRAKFFAANSTF